DRLLQQDLLDIIRREAAFRERRADVQAEFVPLGERHHGADHEHAAGALIEMRTGPDLTPGVTRDQVLEIGIERIPAGDRLVDPGIAEHLAALDHALVAALLVVHWSILPSLRANGSRECAPDDRLREAIHTSLCGHGLLRCARNDGVSVASGSRPP